MDASTLLFAVVIFTVLVAALRQWVLDSPLFELGEASWFPAGSDLPATAAVARNVQSGFASLLATLAAAALVWTAPFRVWVWAVVGLLAVTVVVSPLLAVYRYDVRQPTADEARVLPRDPTLGCEVVVVENARDGPVNGYAIGGPFRDVVGVSAFALAHLPPAQVAALVAHEACHHRERHALVRGGVSVATLSSGAAVVTTLFDALVPPAALAFAATVAVERVVSHWVMRRTEYRADAAAARHTSVDAVVSLLSTLDEATGVDQSRVPRLQRLFSTHPAYADRIARLRDRASTDDPGRQPVPAGRRS